MEVSLTRPSQGSMACRCSYYYNTHLKVLSGPQFFPILDSCVLLVLVRGVYN